MMNIAQEIMLPNIQYAENCVYAILKHTYTIDNGSCERISKAIKNLNVQQIISCLQYAIMNHDAPISFTVIATIT